MCCFSFATQLSRNGGRVGRQDWEAGQEKELNAWSSCQKYKDLIAQIKPQFCIVGTGQGPVQNLETLYENGPGCSSGVSSHKAGVHRTEDLLVKSGQPLTVEHQRVKPEMPSRQALNEIECKT